MFPIEILCKRQYVVIILVLNIFNIIFTNMKKKVLSTMAAVAILSSIQGFVLSNC